MIIQHSFSQQAFEIWFAVGGGLFVVAISIVLHGISVTPLTRAYARRTGGADA